MGVADLRHVSPPSVVELSNRALYTAKHSGRNRVVVADPPNAIREVA